MSSKTPRARGVAAGILLLCAEAAFAGAIPPEIIPVFPDPVTGKIEPPPPRVRRVKFLCGRHEPELVGTHFTVVNVLNPHSPLPLVPNLDMTWEIVVDQPGAPAGTAPALGTPPIPFALESLAAIEIRCPDIAMLLQLGPPGLPLAQAVNSKGYVVLQAPCVAIGPAPPDGIRFACYEPIVQTVYEHAATALLVNKVLFTLNRTVGNLPRNTPLEVILVAPPVGQPLNLRSQLRNVLGLPPDVLINVLDVDVTAQPIDLALDVETVATRPDF